jgi:hypothetical protein
MTTKTTLHVSADGARFEVYARGSDRVLVLLGRDAGRKVRRLLAAGFSWSRAGMADDRANIDIDGEWTSDGMPWLECAATSPELINLACGR